MEGGDVAESWEDADTEELEKRMELRQRHTKTKGSSSDTYPTSHGPGSGSQQPPLRLSKWEGTQYVPPVKILKRPSGDETSAEKSSVEPELKTLAQREAEYATARLRKFSLAS